MGVASRIVACAAAARVYGDVPVRIANWLSVTFSSSNASCCCIQCTYNVGGIDPRKPVILRVSDHANNLEGVTPKAKPLPDRAVGIESSGRRATG